MFKGDNLIGVLLVGLCLVAAGVMIWASATGAELRYNGPGWLVWILAAIVFGGSIWGLVQGFRGRRQSGRGHQWPNPLTGQRSLLDRIRGRRGGSSS